MILLIAMIGYAGMSAAKKDPFSPAKDFPRGALVYAQFADLPWLIKHWNESSLKAKYLESENFHDLTNRHLGLKLASRWQEFNEAAGFPFDLGAISGFADGRASIALYDIGKLDLVFVAPVSDELFAATQLMQNSSKFKEEDLGGDITAYRASVEADRGRQKQEILFTHLKGRLIVATSEKLLAKTIANIKGIARKDRLSDEPSFSQLTSKVVPHLATVWVDQKALNDDYYFKRYWLMKKDPQKLKNIRSGMFDLAVEEGKVIERREYLLDKAEQHASITTEGRRDLLSHVPKDAALYRMSSADRQSVDETIKTVLESPEEAGQEAKRSPPRTFWRWDRDYDYTDEGFSSLSEKFDENIDDLPDDADGEIVGARNSDLGQVLTTARPTAFISISEPKMLAKPLFAQFNNAAVFRLGSPAGFDRTLFESSIEKLLAKRVMVSSDARSFAWTTKSDNGLERRELILPMLDIKVCYTVQGTELFLANDDEFLEEIVNAKNSAPKGTDADHYSDLSVLNIKQTGIQYSDLFQRLNEQNAAADFFTGNIASLVSSVPEASSIEVKREYSTNFLHEETTMHLDEKTIAP